VVAVGAIYQGLSLGSIDLVAENIRINLPQVLKGQALGLLAPIAVTAEVKFSEEDLQASLAAPLLSQAITDLFIQILGANTHRPNWIVEWDRVQIFTQMLTLHGTLTTEGQTAPIEISMGIAIFNGQILHLDPMKISCSIDLPGRNLTSHQIDLGDDVNITQLHLSAGELICQGGILVNP
jgi:LmeA-like phospholipid-binding